MKNDSIPFASVRPDLLINIACSLFDEANADSDELALDALEAAVDNMGFDFVLPRLAKGLTWRNGSGSGDLTISDDQSRHLIAALMVRIT